MAYLSKYTGPDIDRRLAQGTYDDAVAAGFTGSKEEFDKLLAAFNPQEQEKLNNKQDKEDAALETENKTVVGAINYLNANKQDKTDDRLTTDSKIVVEAINEVKYGTIVLDQKKQPREDLGFSTEQKTVVGAVNELNLKIGELDDSKQNAEDDRLDTNDITVVGAINEVHREFDKLNSEYGQHIDEYEEFKSKVTSETTNVQESLTDLRTNKQDKVDQDLQTSDKRITFAINEVNDNLKSEIERSKTTDETLEKVKVPYTDISDSSNPDRKTIMLKNHDSISGFGTNGTEAYNIAMVSKWNKVDLGSAGIPINLNGSEDHPTYNDSEKLAFVSELTGETSRLDEDIKNLNETITTVNQNLSADIAALNQNVTDINTDLDDEIRPAIEKNAKDIGVVNENLTNKIEETEERLQTDINYLKPRVAALETLNIVKVDPENENYAASYELQDSTGKVYGQRINIATDQFIKSVSYDNQILTIVFILQDGSEYSQNIDVSELMNVYAAGGGITITENGVVSISDDTLQMIQYSDSEVRRLEKDKIPYAYDEKTQSNINVILPEGGSYLGNYGDENATVAKAAVYDDGTKQLEIGSSKVHTNINTDSNVTIETSTGKKTIATTDELVNVVNIPIRSLQDKAYTQDEILGWFGVTSVPELKQKISRGSQMYLRYGIALSGNPMYYKMPIEYTAFESTNQIKLVFVGLNTSNDVTSKYEMIMNLDGTVIEGNSNVKLTITNIEPEDIDLSTYVTKEELNDYALKSEIPDISNLATKSEVTDGLANKANVNHTHEISNITGLQDTLDNKVDNSMLSDYALASTVTSGLASKQDTLVSGTNIRTLNGVSLLGEGNIQLDEGSTDYETLTNKPSINSVELSGNLSFEDLGLDVNTTWEQIQDKPEFATVATSGDYNDLTNTPDLAVYQTITDNSLATNVKTIPGAINEIKENVDNIDFTPYQTKEDNTLETESKSVTGAINELNGAVDRINDFLFPDELNKAGTLIYTKNDGKYYAVAADEWSDELGTQVGVIVIPQGILPDGKARIMGIKGVDSAGTPSDTEVSMLWGGYGVDVEGLTNYNEVPAVDPETNEITRKTYYSYLPSDKFSATQNPLDFGTAWDSYSNPCAPSPYKDGALNPAYFATEYTGGTITNCLSDFSGLENTQLLCQSADTYVAANAAHLYKAYEGDTLEWYLPAMGELGFIMPRFNAINEALASVGGVALASSGYFWSSSEYSSISARSLRTYNGYVSYYNNYKSDSFRVRSFARLDSIIFPEEDNLDIRLQSKQDKIDGSLTTESKEIVGAINEIKSVIDAEVSERESLISKTDDTVTIGSADDKVNILSSERLTVNGTEVALMSDVEDILESYTVNLTSLLAAQDSESISTAIGGIDNLNATVQDNRLIVGTISNGSVSVSIRILGNVTTLYYLLDSVVGLTLNEVAITNTSGTLSKSVTTHSVLTENMVINSLESAEATLPLSAAQGKVLNSDKQNKTDETLQTTDKTVAGAINELLAKVQELETKNTELESRLATLEGTN